MREIVNLPRLGDSVAEILLLEWTVKVGQSVAKGAPLVRVETDKAEVEVEAPVGGTVVEILAEVDAEVETGAPLCVIESSETSRSD